MKLVVQKFGGSSVSNVEKIINVSEIILNTYNNKANVIVVVSAQGDTTNQLIEKMLMVNKNPSKREMDVLLSVGEQISIALLTSYIKSLGYPAISLTGWQAGIYTNNTHKNARIRYIDNLRIKEELKNRKIVIVAGFQGVDKNNDITTLGRGGSDTSAVALAVSLNADICQIFTDVDGVYTADPRIIKSARKIDEITFDEMLEMSSLGAKILNNRSVELAKKYNVEIDVISSFSKKQGTRVKEKIKMEQSPVRGIASDSNILLMNLEDNNTVSEMYSVLANLERKNIVISGVSVKNNSCSFIAHKEQEYDILKILNEQNVKFNYFENVSKISLVGVGLISNNNVLYKLFEILKVNNISPYLILSSEISISIVVNKNIENSIINILHEKYKLGEDKWV